MQFREDDASFDEEAWNQFKHEFKTSSNAWALGLGDYEDWLRPSQRSRIYASLTADDSARKQLDDKTRRDQDAVLRRMDFLEGKCIGLHSGHHEWEFLTGDNSTQRLCQALKVPYLGWMASTRLGIQLDEKSRSGAYVYTIVSMHGSGSSQFASTDARMLETRIVPAWIANQYVRGHSCKSIAWSPFERHIIRRTNDYGVEIQTVRCMNVGGFSKGYTDGWKSSYVERAGMLPQSVSWGVIRFKFSNQQVQRNKHGNAGTGKTLDIEQVIRTPYKKDKQF